MLVLKQVTAIIGAIHAKSKVLRPKGRGKRIHLLLLACVFALYPCMMQAQLAGRAQEQQGAQRGQRRDLVLTSVLGSGSFGVVFNGTWRGLRVAVKTLVVHDSLLGTEVRGGSGNGGGGLGGGRRTRTRTAEVA